VAKARDPLGPLLDMNHGRWTLGRMQALAGELRRAGIPVTALSETTRVTEQGTVERDLVLCHSCEGTCCTAMEIAITRADAKRLADNLGVPLRKLPLIPPTGEENEVDDVYGYLGKDGRPCPYWAAGRCTVHGFRPDVCRAFGLWACADSGTFVPRADLIRPRGKRAAKPQATPG